HIFVNGAIVFDGQVIAERKFHAVKYLYVLAAIFEDVAGEHGAHSEPQPMVEPDGGTVVHHPEPDKGLALGIFRSIHVAVVFRLKGCVAWIKSMSQCLSRQGASGIRS